MDKELEELLGKLKKAVEEIEGNNEEGLKEAKEEAIKQVNKSKKGLILATENGALFAGSEVRIMATLASMIHTLIGAGEIKEEAIIEACLRGLVDIEKPGKSDKDRINLVLEQLKEML